MNRVVQCTVLLACAAQLALAALPALAATTFLRGIVLAAGKPVPRVAVSAAGNNVILNTLTDASGHFDFPNLSPGSYLVTAAGFQGSSSTTVDLPVSGADIALSLDAKQLGRVSVTAVPPIHKSGTDVTLNRQALSRSPASGSFPELLVQLPGAARGANGVVHINGDHGDINYVVDGVAIPQELNRNIGTEFNPNDVSFIDVLEGAYPAQYGERFASVLNISTRASVGVPGFTGELTAGSFGYVDTTIGYENSLGRGSIVTAFRNDVTQRGLDPPNTDSPHNNASDANQFLRYTLPYGSDYLNLTLFRTRTEHFRSPTTSAAVNHRPRMITKRKTTSLRRCKFDTHSARAEPFRIALATSIRTSTILGIQPATGCMVKRATLQPAAYRPTVPTP